MGFPANSFLTMAHWPELAQAFLQLARTVNFSDTELPVSIKRLVSYVVSRSSGCQYFTAHTGYQAARSGGISAEKIEAAWEYETNPLFTDAERAALLKVRRLLPILLQTKISTSLRSTLPTGKSWNWLAK